MLKNNFKPNLKKNRHFFGFKRTKWRPFLIKITSMELEQYNPIEYVIPISHMPKGSSGSTYTNSLSPNGSIHAYKKLTLMPHGSSGGPIINSLCTFNRFTLMQHGLIEKMIITHILLASVKNSPIKAYVLHTFCPLIHTIITFQLNTEITVLFTYRISRAIVTLRTLPKIVLLLSTHLMIKITFQRKHFNLFKFSPLHSNNKPRLPCIVWSTDNIHFKFSIFRSRTTTQTVQLIIRHNHSINSHKSIDSEKCNIEPSQRSSIIKVSVFTEANLMIFNLNTRPPTINNTSTKDDHPNLKTFHRNNEPTTISIDFRLRSIKPMSNAFLNSTQIEEDYLLDSAVSFSNDYDTPIDIDEDCTDALTLTVSETEIAEISDSAAGIKIAKSPRKIPLPSIKRGRDSSVEVSQLSASVLQPVRKIRKMMEPLDNDPEVERPEKHLVRLVPDIEDVQLFTDKHGIKLHTSVMNELKKVKDPNIKFDYCDFERGRYKFICPNEVAKNWAMNIVPLLTGLWENPQIKAIDFGIVPKMVRASVVFQNPPPQPLDFFEDVDFKNENIDTVDWRIYKRKPIEGKKTIFFIGIDEKSVNDLKDIGYKPYYANGRTRIKIENKNE